MWLTNVEMGTNLGSISLRESYFITLKKPLLSQVINTHKK